MKYKIIAFNPDSCFHELQTEAGQKFIVDLFFLAAPVLFGADIPTHDRPKRGYELLNREIIVDKLHPIVHYAIGVKFSA
jgi:hypothetical protein